jgi:transcriptional regulator with XRE-family HTH domain
MIKLASDKTLKELQERRDQHMAAAARIDARMMRIAARMGSKKPTGSRQTAPGRITSIRQKIDISQEELARISGYSLRAIANLEAGKAPSKSIRRKMQEVARLLTALCEIMPPAEVGEWLRQSNEALEGQPPMHVIEKGETDRIWEIIHQIDANVAN